ncbi:hypothetical protein [Nostoc sp.]|uniref:hypothetical protein n=1 Tax=Nostoc sp. TaxID=1180 RepID=UPI002FF4F915
MQIIQSPLGNNIYPLGARSTLSNPHTIGYRKQSPSLHLRNHFISHIQTKQPLVTSSKFFFSREHEPSIQPLIGWDSWDNQEINSNFSPLEVDSFDSIAPPENNNFNSSELVKNSILEIMPTRIINNTSNDASSEVNLKDKSKSEKTNKSQQSTEKKSKPKSKAKKAVTSAANNVAQFVDKSKNPINRNEDSLLVSDEPLSVEDNSDNPTLQGDIASDNATSDNDYFSTIASSTTASTSPSVGNPSTLLRNIANDDLQTNSEITSRFSSIDSSVTQSNFQSQEKIELDNDLPIEFSSPNNGKEIFTPASNYINNEQKVISEASESFDISDIPVNPTVSKQNNETYQAASIVDNHSIASQTNLIQAKEVLPTLNSSSQEEELPNNNSNFESITAIEPDLILESTANDFITDNAVIDNSLTLLSALTSPDVDDTPTLIYPSANDENIIETHVAAPNSESSVVKSPITIQQEIDSSLSSEFPTSAPVQLTPTSAYIEDTPSLFRNSDSDEQLVTSELQSAMTVNVSDISAVTSLQYNSNVENTTSKSTESHPILAPAEIVEEAISNDKALGVYVPLSATSPKIADAPLIIAKSSEIPETPTITATSPEIDEAPTISTTSPKISEAQVISAISSKIAETPTITTTSPEIGEAQVTSAISPKILETPIITTVSPEIGEAQVTSATSPEIVETPIITTASPEIGEAQVTSAISPEIAETPIITTASPEIGEAQVTSATSPEIAETPIITTASPEIGEAPVVRATSPEIAETPIITAISPEIGKEAMSNDKPLGVYAPLTTTSPEIGETASIFRKIIDNEQTVESEDNPTSPQDEVSTAPKVEQNAIAENLPAPKGYATGGQVTDSHVENRQQIAPSDTVPAMLTPGEFVINTRDAQKNLPLLHHINTGGTAQDIILPSLQTPNPTEPEETTSPETPTKVDSFSDASLQLKSAETHSPQISNSFIPSSLGLDIGKQKLSMLNSPQLNILQNETIDVDEPSPQYSSPPLIFRKANPTPSQWSNTPSQWSSVEELLNGNNDEFTSFNFSDVESNSQNYEFSQVSESPQVFAKHLPSPRGFADGGEVAPPDISREIEPVTETIESASSSSQGDEKDDTADLEALSREIYKRLRQRIEIERERHGGYSGRLPW